VCCSCTLCKIFREFLLWKSIVRDLWLSDPRYFLKERSMGPALAERRRVNDAKCHRGTCCDTWPDLFRRQKANVAWSNRPILYDDIGPIYRGDIGPIWVQVASWYWANIKRLYWPNIEGDIGPMSDQNVGPTWDAGAKPYWANIGVDIGPISAYEFCPYGTDIQCYLGTDLS